MNEFGLEIILYRVITWWEYKKAQSEVEALEAALQEEPGTISRQLAMAQARLNVWGEEMDDES